MKKLIAQTALTFIAFIASDSILFADSEKKAPNIILYLADDLGYGSLGCYGAPESLLKTPHLDQLAKEGIRFTDSHAPSPVCSPTRYGLITGRFLWRTSRKSGVINSLDPLWIETDRLTIPSMLKEVGYHTAGIGKWHIGFGEKRRKRGKSGIESFRGSLQKGPLDVGFDYFFGVPVNHGDTSGIYFENKDIYQLRSEKRAPFGPSHYGRDFYGIDAPQRVDELVMDTLTDKAKAWLDQRDKEKPFFLYFASTGIHEPITPSDETKGKNGGGIYADYIQDVDNSMGELIQYLKDNDLYENTLIIFTSDNGGTDLENRHERNRKAAEEAIAAGFKNNGDFRGYKQWIFEGGTRVPTLIRWANETPVNEVSDETFSLVDTLATLAHITGYPLAEHKERPEDSQNVWPAWQGKKLNRTTEMAPMITHSTMGVYAIRQGPWKYIEGIPHKKREDRVEEVGQKLFYLATDLDESENLAAKHPQKVKKLQALLDSYRGGPAPTTY